jgi:hypothetical protein
VSQEFDAALNAASTIFPTRWTYVRRDDLGRIEVGIKSLDGTTDRQLLDELRRHTHASLSIRATSYARRELIDFVHKIVVLSGRTHDASFRACGIDADGEGVQLSVGRDPSRLIALIEENGVPRDVLRVIHRDVTLQNGDHLG